MADFNDPRNAWWRHAVCYQIYVRSFADSNGDGVGDLPGITARLPHLRDLGVDALWVTPFYTSPQHDHGYDVADYTDVDPLFGTLSDADEMIDRAHELGVRVIVDLVPNHTSDEHEWFRAALAAGPGSRERARFMFREGRGESGELPPNNWESVFGGPAWTRVEDGEWYLHLFDTTQPDLDWRNPEVADMFDDVLRFWLDRGVDGFRVDVAHGLFKEESLRDQVVGADEEPVSGASMEHSMVERVLRDEPMWDQPEVHDVYRRWRKILDDYPGERMAVAEAWTQTADSMAKFIRSDELHQTFNFHWLTAPWSAEAFAEVVAQTLDAVGLVEGSPTWVLSNHDVTRHVTRYGGGEVGLARREGRDPDDAGAARLRVPLPGRGARPGAGRRGAGVPAGPVLVPHRRARSRWLPGAGAVGWRQGSLRVRAGNRAALDPAADRLGAPDGGRRGGRSRVHAGVLPRGAGDPTYVRDDGGRLRRPVRDPRRRAGHAPRSGGLGDELRQHPGAAARRRAPRRQRPPPARHRGRRRTAAPAGHRRLAPPPLT